MAEQLSQAERDGLSRTLPHWALASQGKALRRDFPFRDFSEAWSFMSRVALLGEKHDHHPNWSNVWNTVHIELSTHDAGGLTANDVRLAQAIDAILG